MNSVALTISLRPLIKEKLTKESKRRQMSMSRCIDELLEKHGEEMSSFFAESFFLEAAPLGIGKDSALNAVCEYLGITSEELMVCGDGYNDIAMFDFAGFSVAMKNAYPEPAAHADVIVPKTNDECGVAYAEGFRQCNVYLKGTAKRLLP